MRGSLEIRSPSLQGLGIIPAHAGLTYSNLLGNLSDRDHPRACGAHNKHPEEFTMQSGSSPRMRGSPDCTAMSRQSVGIIPAHAGLTQASQATNEPSWDHPRACGAHVYVGISSGRRKGSSPRMRGSRDVVARCLHRTGIIPAHAGLTATWRT